MTVINFYQFLLLLHVSKACPIVTSEYWVDWFTIWGGHYNSPDPSRVLDNINHMYSKNASINIYMIIGGTNFAFMNGGGVNQPITTSYDYGAAISENGEITPLYRALHAWIQNLTDWPQKPLAIPSNNP
uniref:Glycoside hydrolase 35 catalytic domain-containing protein n=1 Tax=Acrobeloides nanus TaxID=290746 RepID=A0A914E8I8_9BILA